MLMNIYIYIYIYIELFDPIQISRSGSGRIEVFGHIGSDRIGSDRTFFSHFGSDRIETCIYPFWIGSDRNLCFNGDSDREFLEFRPNK